MRITKKKVAAVVATASVVALGGTAAFAYFSTGGTGNGSASTTTAQQVTITGSAAPGLYPGGSEPITYTIHNPAAFKQFIQQVTVTIVNPDGTPFSIKPNQVALPACTAADFSLTQPAVLNTEVAPGDTVVTSGQITMIDATTNQDNCSNANSLGTIPLHFVA